ncbi:hypothetical protein ACFL9T_19405 [Thermodesulfobacteriota bacterium]
MKLNEFRQKLEEATQQGFPGRHPERIAALKTDYPHHIEVQGNPNFISNDDCFLYVFKGQIPPDILKPFEHLIEEIPDLFEEIGHKLISKGFLSLHDERRPDDRIVIYFDGEIAKHFGRIDNDKIVSKWGKGLTWKHDLFEIPLSYGDRVKYSDGEIDSGVLKETISLEGNP